MGGNSINGPYKEGVETFRVTDRLSDGRAKLDGRHAEPHLQLVAVEGLNADRKRDPRPRRGGH
jgi:hypothetical protein